MSDWIKRKMYWWPVLLRLAVFSLMTSGTTFMAQLHGKKTEDFRGYGWVEWCVFFGPVVLAWFGTKLAFLDQTLARMRDEEPPPAEWSKGESI